MYRLTLETLQQAKRLHFLFRTRKFHHTEASETITHNGKRKTGNKIWNRDKNNEKYKLKDRGRNKSKEKNVRGEGR